MSKYEERWKVIQKFIGAKPDGNPDGPETIGLLENRFGIQAPVPPAPVVGEVDERSAKNIATLLPEVQHLARLLIFNAAKAGITIKVISGTRTYAEQDALYKQATDGRDNDGDGRVDESDERVTKAPAGHSNHNFSLAFDVGVFEGPKYIEDSPKYAAVGKLGKEIGLEWGGDWKFQDEPHFQLRPKWANGMSESAMLTELRKRKADGKPAFA